MKKALITGIAGQESEILELKPFHQGLDPKIHPRVSVQKVASKDVIVIIEVKEYSDNLTLAFGKPFKRVGRSTVRMSKDEYERSILEKHKDKLQFDKQICKGARLKDIDPQLIRDFLKRAKLERRLEFIDMKVFEGDVIRQRDDAIEFVKEHIKLHAEIKGTERVEKWEYPIEALREAITNAICHRDYGVSSSIQVRIFDDRIEVWGCGPLPEPLTPEDLKKKHKSILRNPLIGKCFFLIKYIEEWGTGTNRMIKQCLKHGLPEPIFEETAGDFVVTFRKYRVTEALMKEMSEEERSIVGYINEKGKISRKECTELLKVSPVTAFRYFKSLEKKGVIKKKGKGKKIYYVLI